MAKAEAAELKAQNATDDAAYEQAWREAARQWERGADREADAKRRALYTERADSARESADAPRTPEQTTDTLDGPETTENADPPSRPNDPSLLN